MREPILPPVSAFTANKTTAKINESITFVNNSQGVVDSLVYNYGSGASPATATFYGEHVNSSCSYGTSGTKTVSLTTYNSAGSDVETKTDYITILEDATPPAPSIQSKNVKW